MQFWENSKPENMERPLDLCMKTSKVKSMNSIAYEDEFKYVDHSLSGIAAPGSGIEDNEKPRWLQHMSTDQMVSTKHSPDLPGNPFSACSSGVFTWSNYTSSSTNISVKLYNKALWWNFSKEGTEMIINKAGRLMYPRVEVTVEGLNPSSVYSVGMTVIPVDDKRYKYKDNIWSAVGKSEVNVPVFNNKHPNSPTTGSHWMADMISFHRVKLSNQIGHNKICLKSMHKYMVQISVVHHSKEDQVYNFTIPGTEFIALTAYLNEKITNLKISHNPFAKAFKNKTTSEDDISTSENRKRPRPTYK